MTHLSVYKVIFTQITKQQQLLPKHLHIRPQDSFYFKTYKLKPLRKNFCLLLLLLKAHSNLFHLCLWKQTVHLVTESLVN